MTTGHYLPVFVEKEGRKEFSVCEVYLDDEGYLTAWTTDHSMAAFGENFEELSADLARMLDDVARWKPVGFADLTVGMRLQPADPHSSSLDSNSTA